MILLKGDYLVLVQNKAAFDSYYGISNRLEVSQLNLENSGDQIKLYNAEGTSIESIYYQTTSGWPTEAAGLGATLERSSYTADPNAATTWFDGCMGGSPGKAYSPCNIPVVISEINYNASTNFNTGDWLELKNTTSQTIDLNGWYVKNNAGQTATLPSGTNLTGNGFMVLTFDDALFTSLQPAVTNKTAVNGFTLDNNDLLQLYNKDQKMQLVVKYNNSTPWPLLPNGGGNTLELDTATHLQFSYASNWFAGCFGGSPGLPFMTPCSITGIQAGTHLQTTLELYPNPSQTSCYLSLKGGSGYYTLQVLNALGQVVYQTATHSSQLANYELPIQELAQGMDLVRVVNEGSEHVIRLVRE
jgi:hypothetical protein